MQFKDWQGLLWDCVVCAERHPKRHRYQLKSTTKRSGRESQREPTSSCYVSSSLFSSISFGKPSVPIISWCPCLTFKLSYLYVYSRCRPNDEGRTSRDAQSDGLAEINFCWCKHLPHVTTCKDFFISTSLAKDYVPAPESFVLHEVAQILSVCISIPDCRTSDAWALFAIQAAISLRMKWWVLPRMSASSPVGCIRCLFDRCSSRAAQGCTSS